MAGIILDTTIDSLPGIFYVMNRQGYFVKWNQQFKQVSGYSVEELSVIHALELFQGPDKRKLAASVGEVFQTGYSTVEADFVAKDGTSTPYYFTGKKIQDNGATHLVGMGIDISERRKTELSLKKSEERFRKLTETAIDAIISIDSAGRIQMFNDAAERIFGYTGEEIHHKTIDQLIPERYGAIFMKGIRNYLETGVSTILGQIFEFNGRRKGGDLFPCELSLSEVKAGDEISFIGIVRDITDRKKTEAELEQFTHALQESNDTKDKFFSIIAHDLKSPFNAILGLTNALIQDYKRLDEKRIAGLLNTIKTSSERAFELLENLLAWANAQTGQIVYKPQQVSL
ncbi:MAG: PAS domain S-box protein, partial [Bacteroidales bacterium]|nr:PAS domain S-box protein [Bacteroidales bacterium]